MRIAILVLQSCTLNKKTLTLYYLTVYNIMNQKSTSKIILHLHQLHLRSESQPFNLKFVILQGEQNTQTKLQSRKEIILNNSIAHIEEAFEVATSKDGKILIIVLKTKLKQTSFLGQINIDTNRYSQQGLETINIESALSKCSVKDENSRLILTLTFPKKQQLRQYEVERIMNKQLIIPSRTSTDSIMSNTQSESTVKADSRQRKVSSDFYKKNYKNAEILRQDRKDREKQMADSKNKDRSGSYKKRFEYQGGITGKGKNTIVIMKQKKQKLKEKQREVAPIARDRTPEPIRLDRLAYSSQSKSKTSKTSTIRPRQTTDRSAQKPDKMVISIHAKTQRYQTQSQPVVDQIQHIFSKDSSIKSIEADDKYQSLADKLKQIQMRIEDKKSIQKQSKDEQNRDSVCTFGDAVKISHESDLPTVSNLKILELQQKILKYEEKVINLEKERDQKQRLIDKLTFRYDKLVQQMEKMSLPYEQQIARLQQQVSKLKKPTSSTSNNLQKQLKNQQRRGLNLQNALLLKQNQIKHLKLSVNLLEDERKQLQILLAKKQYKMGHNSSRALLEAEIMANGYPSSIKSQNQLLKSQIQLLQKHIKELNQLVDQYELHNSRQINHLRGNELQDMKKMLDLKTKNIKVQEEKSSKLEMELRRTKLNFAQIMNVVFEKGGQDLVETIQRRIIQRRDSEYSIDTQ